MSASVNVTQWLAWALMIVTGSMNRPGGMVVRPRLRPPARELRAAGVAARRRSLSDPGPSTCPGSRSFLGEWPCVVLADEIRAGEHPRRAEPRRASRHRVPGRQRGSCRHSDLLYVLGNDLRHAQRHDRAVDVRAPDEGPARARRRHAVGLPHPARLLATHAGDRRWGSATGDRRGGSSPSSGAGSVTTSRRPTAEQSTDDARLATIAAGGRCTFDELGGRTAGWRATMSSPRRGSSGISNGWAAGGWPRSCSSTSSRPSRHPRLARARPAPPGVSPELAARLPGRGRRGHRPPRTTRQPPVSSTARRSWFATRAG